VVVVVIGEEEEEEEEVECTECGGHRYFNLVAAGVGA